MAPTTQLPKSGGRYSPLVVRSWPDGDASAFADKKRRQFGSRAFYISTDAPALNVFTPEELIALGEVFCRKVITFIAQMNHHDVSSYAIKYASSAPFNAKPHLLNDRIWKDLEEIFTEGEREHYGDIFLSFVRGQLQLGARLLFDEQQAMASSAVQSALPAMDKSAALAPPVPSQTHFAQGKLIVATGTPILTLLFSHLCSAFADPRCSSYLFRWIESTADGKQHESESPFQYAIQAIRFGSTAPSLP
jgi:hypothetical protein